MALPIELCKYLSEGGEPVLNGYLRFLGESERRQFQTLMARFQDWEGGEPFAVTAFGDVLVWDGAYVLMYKLIDEKLEVILSGFSFFFANISDAVYQTDYFDLPLYEEVKKKVGDLNDDESYTFEPLPRLGGVKDVAHAGKGKTYEYLSMLMG